MADITYHATDMQMFLNEAYQRPPMRDIQIAFRSPPAYTFCQTTGPQSDTHQESFSSDKTLGSCSGDTGIDS